MTSRRHLLTTTAAFVLAGCSRRQSWELQNVSAVLPDLQFDLRDDRGREVDATTYAGHAVLLYFGYTHCPDVCPATLATLAAAVAAQGEHADEVRILFVSLDPRRDTPALLHEYVRAFSPQAVGLGGSLAQVQAVAKRYHVAFNYGAADARGDYAVTHSAAVYVFGRDGRGMLIGSDKTPAAAIEHDLRQLLAG
ncbi:MAG: SCO family protein [Burkholderiales bacterium]|nr:SCO family protein [Burkholderiales bacterium]